MTVKTVVRYRPPNPLYGARELSPEDFKSQGVFTQKKLLRWTSDTGWWLDADEAKISPEALTWLEERKEFTVERQEVDDEEASSVETAEAETPAVEGEQPAGTGTPGTTTGTTTASTPATGPRSRR